MSDDKFDAFIVEFIVDVRERNNPDNPADALVAALNKEKFPFAVDEVELSRQEVLQDPYFSDWREGKQEIPEKLSHIMFFTESAYKSQAVEIFKKIVSSLEQEDNS